MGYCIDHIYHTISIGISEQGLENAIEAADIAMYQAKQDGRNRLQVHRTAVESAKS